MPRSGGIYTLPPSYLAVTGTTIDPVQHNPPLEDLAQAMTDSLPRDGSAPMVGPLNMAGQKITALAAGTAATDAVRFDQLDGSVEDQITAAPSKSTLAANDKLGLADSEAADELKHITWDNFWNNVHTAVADYTASLAVPDIHVVHDQAAGVAGDVFTSAVGSTATAATLNTVLVNTIPGVTLSANQIRDLPAGDYRAAWSIVFRRNSTATGASAFSELDATLESGMSGAIVGRSLTHADFYYAGAALSAEAYFTITGPSRLTMRMAVSATVEQSAAAIGSNPNRYAELRIWKLK